MGTLAGLANLGQHIGTWLSAILFIQAQEPRQSAPAWLRVGLFLLFVFGVIVFFLYVALSQRPRVEDSLTHWHVTIPGLQLTPERFYGRVDIAMVRPSGPRINFETVHLSEGGLSAHFRPYLRIRRAEVAYYVFAAPLGDSFFVSSWLLVHRSVLGKVLPRLPLVGWLFGGLSRLFSSETLFTYDSALHFHELVHTALLNTIDKLTQTEKLPALPPEVRKPVLRELYARPTLPQLTP